MVSVYRRCLPEIRVVSLLAQHSIVALKCFISGTEDLRDRCTIFMASW
jgi:hypothetical protein